MVSDKQTLQIIGALKRISKIPAGMVYGARVGRFIACPTHRGAIGFRRKDGVIHAEFWRYSPQMHPSVETILLDGDLAEIAGKLIDRR